MRDVNASTPWAMQRAWWWCVCNQLGYQQAYPGDVGIRSSHVTIDFHKRKCDNVYGTGVWPPKTAEFNAKYGGKHPKTTNVFYFQGSEDPWQWAGITVSPDTKTLPVYVINGDHVGHCRDLHAAKSDDPIDVGRARKAGEAFVGKILSN